MYYNVGLYDNCSCLSWLVEVPHYCNSCVDFHLSISAIQSKTKCLLTNYYYIYCPPPYVPHRLEDILYPTLISSCYGVPDSKDVLKLEINCKLLCVYLKVSYMTSAVLM